MEECRRLSRRKLVMWFTKTFKPLMTHDELEPIMATLGFIGLEPEINSEEISWKSYKFSGADSRAMLSAAVAPPPMPRLPYPSIDGLHIYTYTAFLDSVNFYIGKYNISDLFHIRGLPLSGQDQNRNWCRIGEESVHFVYREETLDQITVDLFSFYQNCLDNTNTTKDSNDTKDETNDTTGDNNDTTGDNNDTTGDNNDTTGDNNDSTGDEENATTMEEENGTTGDEETTTTGEEESVITRDDEDDTTRDEENDTITNEVNNDYKSTIDDDTFRMVDLRDVITQPYYQYQ